MPMQGESSDETYARGVEAHEKDQDEGLDKSFDECELNDNPTALTLRQLLGEPMSSRTYKRYHGTRVALS